MAALTEVLRLMRPRTIARISRTASDASEQTKEIGTALKALSKDTSGAIEDLTGEVGRMREGLEGRIDDLVRDLQVSKAALPFAT